MALRNVAIVLSVILGMTFVFGTEIVRGAPLTPVEGFYRDCIQRMIVRCQHKTRLLDCKGQNLHKEGGKALLQLYFYETHKEEIVCDLALQNAGMNRAKVDSLVIKAFNDFTTTVISDNRY